MKRLAIGRDQRQLAMTVRRDVTKAGEMLQGRGDAGRLDAANRRPDELADLVRVVAERSDSDRRVRRIRRKIADGAVVDGHTERPQLEPHRPPNSFGECRIADRPEGHVPGERRRPIPQPDELATLLVGGDEDRQAGHRTSRTPRFAKPSAGGRGLDRRGERADLARVGDVRKTKEGHARRRRGRQPPGDIGRQLEPVEGKHQRPEDGVAHVAPLGGGVARVAVERRRSAHPLTAPAVTPPTIRFWISRKKTRTGNVNNVDAAIVPPQSVPKAVRNVASQTGSVKLAVSRIST